MAKDLARQELLGRSGAREVAPTPHTPLTEPSYTARLRTRTRNLDPETRNLKSLVHNDSFVKWVERLRENLADFNEKYCQKSRNLYQDVTCNRSIKTIMAKLWLCFY